VEAAGFAAASWAGSEAAGDAGSTGRFFSHPVW